MSYEEGKRSYQLGLIPMGFFGPGCVSSKYGQWWDPAKWQLEYTDFVADAENLGRQWILLNRRGNEILSGEDQAALQLVADEYQRYLETEVRRTGSGWFWITDDREKLANFKRLYQEWYNLVLKVDQSLPSYVPDPSMSVGPIPEQNKGVFEQAKEKLQDLLKNEYVLPALGVGIVFLGTIWLTSRSGAQSGVRHYYR